MNFKDLIDKLKESRNGSSKLLNLWLDELQDYGEINYYIIYGFIRGLYASSYITEEDEKSLIDLLIILKNQNK